MHLRVAKINQGSIESGNDQNFYKKYTESLKTYHLSTSDLLTCNHSVVTDVAAHERLPKYRLSLVHLNDEEAGIAHTHLSEDAPELILHQSYDLDSNELGSGRAVEISVNVSSKENAEKFLVVIDALSKEHQWKIDTSEQICAAEQLNALFNEIDEHNALKSRT